MPKGITARILVVLLAVCANSPLWPGDGDRHRHDHGDRYGVGLGFAYGPPYWDPYWPGYPYYYPGYYYPFHGPYRPPYGAHIGLSYHSGYYTDAFGLGFSFPLWFGPHYEPAPPASPVLVPSVKRTAQALPQDCLQLREYQTQITVDGEAVPAWGTACLQADGSWKIVSGPTVEQ